MKNVKQGNANRIIIIQLNIISINNKFDFRSEMIHGNTDILLTTKTRIDTFFPNAQFQVDGHAAHYRLDRNWKGGGMLLYVRDDIPPKALDNADFGSEIVAIFVEIIIRGLSGL